MGGGEEEKRKYRATRGHRHLRIEMRSDCKSASGKPNLENL